MHSSFQFKDPGSYVLTGNTTAWQLPLCRPADLETMERRRIHIIG